MDIGHSRLYTELREDSDFRTLMRRSVVAGIVLVAILVLIVIFKNS